MKTAKAFSIFVQNRIEIVDKLKLNLLIFVFVFVLSVYFGWSGPMKAKVRHLGRSAMHELCICLCICICLLFCILVFHWSGPMKAKVRNFGRSEVSHA